MTLLATSVPSVWLMPLALPKRLLWFGFSKAVEVETAVVAGLLFNDANGRLSAVDAVGDSI